MIKYRLSSFMLMAGLAFSALPQKPSPNVVFILVDDYGWKDVSYNGSPYYETPNIDKLASESMVFNNGYAAAAISSPTRCSIMTGKYPARLNITDWIPGYQYGLTGKQTSQYKLLVPKININMPLEEETVAEALKENGYQTCFVGKWHCCEDSLYYPQYQGFDRNIGGWMKGNPNGDQKEGNAYFTPYHNPYLPDGPKGEFLTDRLGNEAVNWIKTHKDNKFFMYLSFYAVHTPIQPKPEKALIFKDKAHKMGIDTLKAFSKNFPWLNDCPNPRNHWKERTVQSDPDYAALISSMDENVGKVIDYLKESGLYDNTIICFLSDNGGLSTAEGSPTCNYPLRGGKGWLYEGGIRVPFLIRIPYLNNVGKTCTTPVISTDFYPTILSACGLKLKPEQHMDGVDLMPLLKGGKIDRTSLFWHYPQYGGKGDSPASAVRDGDWKLIEFYENGKCELYNLKKDISESNDLSSKNPDKVLRLKNELHNWIKNVGAKLPTPNPYYSVVPVDTLKINADIKNQKFEGWGVSISWWANDLGKRFTEKELSPMVDWMTNPKELNMNIFRYNIGGGESPNHKMHMRLDAQVPGYKNGRDSAYDWNSDAAQRKILLMIKKNCPNAVFEAASYSPPYWMTISGCTSGTPDGSDNIRNDCFGDFAKYLADCVEHYKKKYNVTFKTISPVNEPYSNWWKEGGKQEGCAFNQANQEKIIKTLYQELKNRDMLKYTSISAMDANSIDECMNGVLKYEKDSVLQYISQINTHSYAGTKRAELGEFAKSHNIRLWQSESGPLNYTEKGLDNYLIMAERMAVDLNVMRPNSWCDWQYYGGGYDGVWSLVGFDKNKKIFVKNKGYYCHKQFMNFINPGYTIIDSNHDNVLAAISPDGERLVVVAVNRNNKNSLFNFDVKSLNEEFVPVEMYRTSADENCERILRDFSDDSSFNLILKSKSVTTIVFNKK
ncbi:MAG: sulfatase-like hydrolase/transferase [Muribaculaceae bacterium]|nr:sulfatase-like hydrolase/transferase [Muribaculaceae bacterium]